MKQGTELFTAEALHLADDKLHAPSGLPSWTRAHVIAHVARNADALGNLLTWALTGIETPMYRDAQQRELEIAASAAQPSDALRRDLMDSNDRFDDAIGVLPAAAWAVEVRTRAGRTIPAAEVPWMRCREVWVHRVDLATGASFADFPTGLVRRFLTELAGTFASRPDCPPFVATDTEGTWSVGPDLSELPDQPVICGPAYEILGWLLGRSAGQVLVSSTGSLPAIPTWL